MHKFILIVMVWMSFTNSYAQDIMLITETATLHRVDIERLTVQSLQVKTLKPSLNADQIANIIVAADQAARAFDVPLNIVLAISFIESSFRLNAVNKASNDYGIMQVNAWHVKKSKLSKRKLLTDYNYSYFHGVRIFAWFYKTYPLDEAIRRYNCGTKPSCINYKKVKKYLTKVKASM